MSFPAKLHAGEIVTIGKSKAHQLVIRFETRVDHDRLRGDSYSVHEFDVVPMPLMRRIAVDRDGNTVPDTKLSSTDLMQFDGQRQKSYHLEGGSMPGAGKMIKASDLKIVGKVKLQTKIIPLHTISKAKYYG